MCGVAAVIVPDGHAEGYVLQAMTDVIAHRGPDGQGVRIDGCVGLGHRRLSILDTSAEGHQPMSTSDGRYWITYNGEVYNFVELRAELEGLGHQFRSSGDTEVVLAAVRQWGVEALVRFNGMFAFVIHDTQDGRVFAARDRYGVKPLYWWRSPSGMLALASEIKQFTVLDGWAARLNGQRAYDFLNWGLMDHTAETLFDGVFQLRGGEYVEASVEDLRRGPGLPVHRWHTPSRTAAPATTFDTSAERLRTLFLNSVRLRLRADVPVGTGLSGGLDSSSIVCAVHHLLGEGDVGRNAFSARSHDPAFDEGPYMDAVVERTKVAHHVVYPDPDDLFAHLSDLVWFQDEPFGTASVFAQWRVFGEAAASSVKVTLDGHGADEILAGYHPFFAPRLRELVAAGKLGDAFTEWRAIARMHGHGIGFLAGHLLDELAPDWIRNRLRAVSRRTVLAPSWLDMARLGARAEDPMRAVEYGAADVPSYSLSLLTAIGLPQMLHWSDRSSMACSVESREPFLDPDLVDFALGLPSDHKIAGGETKRVLRAGMKELLPETVRQRRDKKGFLTPEQRWLTQDRPETARALVADALSAGAGIFSGDAVQKTEGILSGRRPYHATLWRIMVFGAWLRRFKVALP